MDGLFIGFSVIAVPVLIGVIVSWTAPDTAKVMRMGITPLVYYIANPLLMVTLVAETDVREVAGVYTPLALGAALLSAAVFALYGVLAKRPVGQIAVGAMSGSYANAGNMGVPIALYMVGSSAPVVAVLLAQLLVLAPLYITVFGLIRQRDSGRGAARGRAGMIIRSVLNPVTLGVLAGAIVSLVPGDPPEPLWEPVTMIGRAGIPLMLIAFGIALAQQRPFAMRTALADDVVSVLCKLLVMPGAAWALGGPILGLQGAELVGVVAMAALPTAQNVFIFASHHGMPTTTAKDVTFATSVLSLPVVMLVAWLMG